MQQVAGNAVLCALVPALTFSQFPQNQEQDSPCAADAFKVILLLETPCPFVRWFVRSFVGPPKSTASNAHDISATKRATGDPLVSKRPDVKCEIFDFWISGI